MAKNVPTGPGGGGRAAPHEQKPSLQKENKTNVSPKGDVRFGVAPSGQRGSQKGCH
jgi:hypothetical protein